MDMVAIKGVFMAFFRKKRIKQFLQLYPLEKYPSIIDIGGTTFFWDMLNCPNNIIILNRTIPSGTTRANYKFVAGDARHLDFPDNSFDLAFSNSVIEHVGTLEDQKKFSAEMRRVSKAIYCQTPNRYFFVEPHLVTPFIHFLPRSWQRRLIRRFSLWGLMTKPDQNAIDNFLETTRLLTFSELRKLFPDCIILRERFMLMTKSFIVVRRYDAPGAL
jgi:hypothetical protein